MYKSFHVSRAQRAMWAADNPIGDPFGGPAYGEKTDIGGVVGSVLGGIFGSDAADSAADAQTQAAKTASDTQLKMFNQSREDQAPWRDTGRAALNELAYRMGLSSNRGGTYMQTAEQIRNELLPAYSRSGQSSASTGVVSMFGGQTVSLPAGQGGGQLMPYYGPDGSIQYRYGDAESQIDEAGLSAAIQQRLNEQRARQQAESAGASSDPNYGSLLRRFSASDLDADPVYQSGLQFGLDEGRKGVNNHFAASGQMLSGAALKALTRFGNDYASTKANDSYNRFNNNQTQIYNRLAGVSGTGQTSATNIASQGISTGNQLAQNMMAAGDARGASYINQNNAMQGMLGGVYKGLKGWSGFGSTPDYSGYTPETSGWAGSYSDNPFQASGF